MKEVHRDVLAVEGAKTLLWVGGRLFDIAKGWQSIPLDGSEGSSIFTGYGDQFDAAVVAPQGDVVALLASTGTKGLLLASDARFLREINRSYYHADAYRYPLALFTLPDGRTGLVHCPEEYNRLEVEDAVTGERRTVGADRTPTDFFHSRLAVSPSGRYLLSAGWVWHPWGCIAVYDLHQALADPTVLDSDGNDLNRLVQPEVAGACFVDDDVVLSTAEDDPDPESELDPDELAPLMLARWSTSTKSFIWRTQLELAAGDLVPIAGHVLALNSHPRLFDATTGELVAEWPDISTDSAESSIVWSRSFAGPARVAVDQTTPRFAVTDGERITVIHLE
ncbi:hypothetical protein [Nocardia altamirensis]|uniref:hypothetical protein n=1 Tax=Nocardia altamirensis TaxID=472158 RepID=UPI00084080BC|nr:hypothetical protein [Nocardia altamirensis]